ncbi:DUF6274 family protein [Streptomyces sp. NBC_00102]|uniref:DUF6274 family protein n=1 Tax=Streptomyces sp. NBC_00102 TaxID=2975652 RepID=UPI002254156B|nr:DUF6274 family protein [Streptomyces sp. NBC_00102]MCX5398069.1 DUF6274 family protein [Streptomyces sp. NBC_00102]
MRTPVARHDVRALLRAHAAAVGGRAHLARHCAACHRLLRLAMTPAPAPAPPAADGPANAAATAPSHAASHAPAVAAAAAPVPTSGSWGPDGPRGGSGA